MYDISDAHLAVREARIAAGLTQRGVAERMGTSQSAIANLERGVGNPTLDTLVRCAEALGLSLGVTLAPLRGPDPVIERYKRDVDRASLRENLRKSVDERVRTLAEWQEAGRALQAATARVKQAKAAKPARQARTAHAP